MAVTPFYNTDVTIFGETNFRNQRKKFGIKKLDRRRHMYVLGKTGMGKTSMIQHMIVQDMRRGESVCVFDSEGKIVDQMLHYVPRERLRDVVYFNPADISHPIGFNVFDVAQDDEVHRQELIQGLLAIFEEVWSDVWGPRFEYFLKHVLLTLAQKESTTLLHVLPFITNPIYRDTFVNTIDDPVLKSFWHDEYAKDPQRFEAQAVTPLKGKISELLSNPLTRNIVGQSKTSFSFRDIIEKHTIVFLVLKKSEIGSDVVRILGSCFLLKLHLENKKEEEIHEDVFLYVDEFHHFSTQLFSELLGTSHYELNLVLVNQYLEQIPEGMRQAIFGNVGTFVFFRVSADDAELLAEELKPKVASTDLIKLPAYAMIVKLCIDGETSTPFTAVTPEPLPIIGIKEKVIRYSQEHYSRQRHYIEAEISESLTNNLDKQRIQQEKMEKQEIATNDNIQSDQSEAEYRFDEHTGETQQSSLETFRKNLASVLVKVKDENKKEVQSETIKASYGQIFHENQSHESQKKPDHATHALRKTKMQEVTELKPNEEAYG